jgi:hypothetical protein
MSFLASPKTWSCAGQTHAERRFGINRAALVSKQNIGLGEGIFRRPNGAWPLTLTNAAHEGSPATSRRHQRMLQNTSTSGAGTFWLIVTNCGSAKQVIGLPLLLMSGLVPLTW